MSVKKVFGPVKNLLFSYYQLKVFGVLHCLKSVVDVKPIIVHIHQFLFKRLMKFLFHLNLKESDEDDKENNLDGIENHKAGEMECHEADRSTSVHRVGFMAYFNLFVPHNLKFSCIFFNPYLSVCPIQGITIPAVLCQNVFTCITCGESRSSTHSVRQSLCLSGFNLTGGFFSTKLEILS